ncbi:uncharacterized protein LOC119996924 [Tripterygium wilfordii]|uniref:uncharacterized protein LOC119996924 n=1 Tax=Tripterygium wilfordii TaxID=458696 RepID=UPI0018F7E68C|nr:uncharacterized protein LOC119996924 [Tripterygium wilfordii]
MECFGCGNLGHKWADCTSARRGRSQARTQQQQSQIQHALTQGRVFALGHPNFVGGTFLVSNCLVRVLFDSGATTSFTSTSLANSLELDVSPIRYMFAMTSPFGYTTSLEGWAERIVCRFGEIELMADLYVLDFKNFDVDWLTKHRAMIDFWMRRVTLNVPGASLTISASCGNVVKPIPVVEEFIDVFSEDLSRIPLRREIEFTIELVSDTKPISIAPY